MIFDKLSSSGQSAVCIKLLKYNHDLDGFNGPYLWTAKRDDISALAREKIDHIPRLRRYAPDENKAFSDIMSRTTSRDYFFCNDLQAMREYFNTNPHWRDFYNAVVVVPIKPCRRDVQNSTIGFLCVDSLHGRMIEEMAVSALVLIAEILYLHISQHSYLLETGPTLN